MLAEELRVSRAVVIFEHRFVVVHLGKRMATRDQKSVVDSRMTNIMTNGGHQEDERIDGREQTLDWIDFSRSPRWCC